MNEKRTPKQVADLIASECLAVRVRMLNRVITSVYDDELRPLGMTVAQLNQLVVIRKLGKATARQVVRILQMDASTVSRNLERMRQEGWITEEPAEDARSRKLAVTQKGAARLKDVLPAWRRAQARARKILGEPAASAFAATAAQLRSR